MRERCWFIPEQVLKGKLPYRDFETFYGPPNPFLLAVVYCIGGIGLTPERATGFACRLSSPRHVLSCPTLELHRRFRVHAFAALVLVGLGVAAYAWMGRWPAPCAQSISWRRLRVTEPTLLCRPRKDGS
jgi:hypothetical protein